MASASTSASAAASREGPRTETELVEAEARPREGESVAQSLKRSFFELHGRRGQAYGRLRRALRDSLAADAKDLQRFQIEVAHVTENLTLVGEGVRALRKGLYYDYLPHSKTAVKWLDRIQALEEKKLVAFVSLSALQRSRATGALDQAKDGEETQDEKIGRFTRELADIDEEITDIIDEMREFVAEELDDE